MLIDADFSRRIDVGAEECEWVSSPRHGVERVMLDRVGAEKARDTRRALQSTSNEAWFVRY